MLRLVEVLVKSVLKAGLCFFTTCIYIALVTIIFLSKEACSWRNDSTRCYPGECEHELAANCKCSKGFTGRHCEISKLPDISVDIDSHC